MDWHRSIISNNGHIILITWEHREHNRLHNGNDSRRSHDQLGATQ